MLAEDEPEDSRLSGYVFKVFKVKTANDDKLEIRAHYMTNGSERVERIERILERVAESQEQFARNQERLAKSQEQLTSNHEQLAKGQEQLVKSQEQLTRHHEQFARNHEQLEKSLERLAERQHEMAARQQYHDEAFERHDAEMKVIREAIAADAENIRALVRIAEIHHRRLEHLEGGEPA